jgi:UDP-N-acetylglucosamine 2-epimerase (non-hydrolysing)
MKKIILVVGARPNFMKIAPVLRELNSLPKDFNTLLVHTGQHYDKNMSEVFFDELSMPEPDMHLNVGSASHAIQTARIMEGFEKVLFDFQPDLVMVPGDVNSTVACALTGVKEGIPVAHLEAGLRSFDRTMPEEINRVVTDHISEMLFVTEKSGLVNLEREGISSEKIHFVGNTMIDTLAALLPKALQKWPELSELMNLSAEGVRNKEYVLVTLHRPSNVDDPAVLKEIVDGLCRVAEETPVIFPVHPRTAEKINELGMDNVSERLNLIGPLGYLEFLSLTAHASVVLTDSGGIQEETTWLGIPCLTARPNTERPVTITKGTNRLIESSSDAIFSEVRRVLNREISGASRPELWDGKAAERIVQILRSTSK